MRRVHGFGGVVGTGLLVAVGLLASPIQAQKAPPKLDVPDSVSFEADIEYTNPDGQHLQLDMARPKAGDGPFPGIVCIHGGGFRGGSRKGYDGLCLRLADKGYVAVTVSYRLAPKYQFPAAIHDVKAAVRWLRANAKKYKIDPERIGVTGGSAGGHLAQFLGVTAGVKEFEGEGGHPDQSSRVACVVNYYGPSDFTKSYGKSVDAAEVLPLWLGGNLEQARHKHVIASPLYWVTPAAAATLCIHGTEDKYVAHEQAVWMIDKLKAADVEAELLTLKGAGHGFKGKDAEDAEKAMLAFFDKRLRAEPDNLSEKQHALLRGLEKEITAVRGLAFKSAVAARRIAEPKVVAITYDVTAKQLLLPDEPAACDRAELLRALVHALLDQQFDLAKLRKKATGADAKLALEAVIAGDAAWTTIEVRRKDDPNVANLLDEPLEKASDLRRSFISAQGARYVQALHKKGGWKRVDSAYRFPPDTSASILHPEGVATIDLGPGETRGEFGLIEMFARHPKTAADAVRAAAGWQGDRYWEDGAKKAWVIVFDKPENARRFQGTLAGLRAAQNPELQSARAEPGVNVWRDKGGAFVAVRAVADRVFALEAPGEEAYRALCEAVEGPPAVAIYMAKEERLIPFGVLIDRLLEADLVCIGETHDSDLHHRVQHQIIKSLFARDERLGVGLEMFQRPFQDELDRFGRGAVNEEEFLKATEYRQRWGFAWSLYRPIVDFCRHNGVALAALNAPKELTARISKVGYAGLTDEEKRNLGPIAFQVVKHRGYWYERLAEMHGQKDAPAEQKERSYQVMTTWDDYMAASAARFQQERNLRRLVILAGSGHIERGFGIPERASKRSGGKALTIGVQVGGTPDQFRREPLTDFLVIVK